MPLSDHLSTLLDTEGDLPLGWHHRYGVTSDRTAKLSGSPKDSNSFLNPKSETALTLFMLGRMDEWFQVRSEPAICPRNGDGWNEKFFRAVKIDTGSWPRRSGQEQPLVSWLAELCGCEREAALDAVLLFEFEATNEALQSDHAPPPVSFLDLTQKWCLFDAVIILPTLQQLIFVESKLASDMSRGTARFSFVSQAIRGWESAFLLTRRQESVYHRWTFKSILLCPRKPFEYRTAYYSYVFNDPADHLARYRMILEKEYAHQLNRGRFDSLFDEFHQTIEGAVKVIHWDELAGRINPAATWIDTYLARLKAECGSDGQTIHDAARCRFRLAGIDVPDR